MVVNVAQLLKSDVGTTRRFTFDEMLQPFGDPVRVVSPIRGTVNLIRTNHGIVGQGKFSTAVDLECCRCLDNYVEELTIDFIEEFIPVVDVDSGAQTNIPRADGTFLITDKHELELVPAIREYGLLALPMKPLCRSDCAGLCPRCGANRNCQSCGCVLDEPDERFAVLRALLNEERH